MGTLRETFLAAASDSVRAALAPREDLEQVLTDIVDRCRGAHPTVRIDPARFVEHLGRHVGEVSADGGAPSLIDVHAADLWLALGCADGDAAALAGFDRLLAGDIDAALKHMALGTAQKDDVAQAVRERLLVKKGDAPARIGDYSGRGPLAGWVRVAATRVALSMLRRKDPAASAVPPDALADVAASLDDPELEHVRARHRGDFKAAFQDALRSLTAHDRTVLRLYLVDQLNIDRIGALYGVHRATVARWIARSRDTVRDETKQLLCARLHVEGAELESLVRVVQSQLDLSMSRILREDDE